jgi:hypothetical protein
MKTRFMSKYSDLTYHSFGRSTIAKYSMVRGLSTDNSSVNKQTGNARAESLEIATVFQLEPYNVMANTVTKEKTTLFSKMVSANSLRAA